MTKREFSTNAVWGGFEPSENNGVMNVPLYQTTAYQFESTQDAKELFELKKAGNIYTRLQNPTTDILEKRVTLLEGGVGSLALASGHSAMVLTFLNLCKTGDEIVAAKTIYGGAVNMMGVTLNNLGIKTTFVDPDDIDGFEKAITDKTKAIFVEVIANPNANLLDIDAISKVAKKYGIPFIVDNTLATPYLYRPIEHGADIVISSATKYLGGHGNSMCGIVTDAGTFEFKGNKRFEDYNNPDVSYHGVVFADLGKTAFITRLRVLGLRDLGPCPSPFNSYLILQGMETLPLRMKKHSENALEVAKWLKANDEVEFVNYVGLESSPYYALAKKVLPNGCGGIMTFGLKGDRQRAAKFIDSLDLIKIVANLGDTKTIISHPATTTHSQLSKEQLEECFITEQTIRLSVGIEDVKDIINDLDRAINLSK